MKMFGKKKKEARKESKATRWFRIILWRCFVRWKVRERIAFANKWADGHRGDTMLITVGCLLFSLIVGAFLTLGTENDGNDNFMSGVEPVESMFRGMQQIQNAKAYHISQMEQMARDGQRLKHELDSLVILPHKTHDDSLQIVIRYKQLELIVNNLEKGE